MNLAVIVDTFPRWSERFIARELNELVCRGISVTVFCLKAGRLPATDDREWAGLLARRKVIPHRVLPAFRPPDDAMQQRLAAAKREFGVQFFRLARGASLRDCLQEGAFQHVHAHFANLPSTLGWLAATAAEIPFSLSVHARDLFVEPQLLAQKLADAVAVFACHARAFEHLHKLAAPPGKIRLMRHGLPLEDYPFAEHKSFKNNRPARLLAAGRFVPKKGFDELLQAVAACTDNFQLTLLGEGPGARKLAARIRALKLEKRVFLAPPAGGSAFLETLTQADAFIAPYKTAPDGDSDGVPNIVLEAFALGVPVIGTDTYGLREVLTPETGAVVSTGDLPALAGAIQDFIRSPEHALTKTLAARGLAEREYDIKKNIAPLLDVIRHS